MKGTVKWYNARKGYGFITPDDNSDDVFIHATSLKDCGLKKLYTGSEVSFEVDQDDKGKRAKSIKITKEVKPEQIKKATTVFTNVVIGIICFAAMWAFLNFIIPGGVF